MDDVFEKFANALRIRKFVQNTGLVTLLVAVSEPVNLYAQSYFQQRPEK